MEILSCHSEQRQQKTIFLQANVMSISTKFQLHSPYGFCVDDFLTFFSYLAFLLPWQPIKFSCLDKIHIFGKGLFKKHFSKTFVKISAVR